MSHERTDFPPVIVGKSLRIRQVRQLIEKVGRSRVPVLIQGETGTGKEVVARAIHAVRNEGPFVAIDCASLPPALMESELFGYRRGAFTGAYTSKPGLIELAHGGTAFFDEIGELPLELQGKLLRLIQEREYRPIGSVQSKKAEFRIVAATNRDLKLEVAAGRFRADLYYRLNVVSVKLPPLRERKEDIPDLVAHLLAKYGGRHTLTRECMDALMRYDWPGNVRELENAIERMVALNSGPLIHTEDLPSAIQNFLNAERAQEAFSLARAGASAAEAAPLGSGPGSTNGRPVPSLSELEKEAILRALEYAKGDTAMAAQLLGIGRTTLYRRLKEYGLKGCG